MSTNTGRATSKFANVFSQVPAMVIGFCAIVGFYKDCSSVSNKSALQGHRAIVLSDISYRGWYHLFIVLLPIRYDDLGLLTSTGSCKL